MPLNKGFSGFSFLRFLPVRAANGQKTVDKYTDLCHNISEIKFAFDRGAAIISNISIQKRSFDMRKESLPKEGWVLP